MRSLILAAPGAIQLEDRPLPNLSPGDLLLRVRAATTCGTDLKAWRRGHPQIPMPGPFGHEYSGDVVAVGEGAKFEVGDAVMGVHSAPCQRCYWCVRGQENLCDSIMASKVLGSYAEFLHIPARIARLNVRLKPDAMPYRVASLLEPYACVAQGILELSAIGAIVREGSVLVIGPGAIGLMFVAALRSAGIDNVTLAGRNPERLAVGAEFGAATVPAEAIPARAPGYDIVIECTGMVEVWESSINHVRRGGVLMLFGGPPGGTRVSFDTYRLHYDQITVLSPFHFGTNAVELAYEWLCQPRVPIERLITADRPLEDADQVFRDLAEGRGIKYAFIP